MVGCSDDVAAFIAARNVGLAQLKLNRMMRAVNVWMAGYSLSLVLSKIEIVLTKKRIPTILPMRVEEEVVKTKAGAKYLRVIVDSKLCFWNSSVRLQTMMQGESLLGSNRQYIEEKEKSARKLPIQEEIGLSLIHI